MLNTEAQDLTGLPYLPRVCPSRLDREVSSTHKVDPQEDFWTIWGLWASMLHLAGALQ